MSLARLLGLVLAATFLPGMRIPEMRKAPPRHRNSTDHKVVIASLREMPRYLDNRERNAAKRLRKARRS